jgi:hypothetical protein
MRSLFFAVVLSASGLPGFAALASDAAPPAPPIYRWVDENGVAHYTTDEDQIPASLRRRFGLPTQPLAREPLDASAPPAEPDAPLESSAAEDAWAAQERGTPPVPAAAPDAPAGVSAPASEDGDAPLPDVAANAGDGSRLEQIELRIAELSAAIAADEDALSAWIGDPNGADAIEVGEKPEFREIAKRLPKRIQELEALRSERDALESATP